MAQDFHEETYFKRYMLAKLAYEAQHVMQEKMKNKILKEKEIRIYSGPAEIIPKVNYKIIKKEPQQDILHENPLDILADDDFGQAQPNLSISGDDRHSIKSELDDFREKPMLLDTFEADFQMLEKPKPIDVCEPLTDQELRNSVFISKYDILKNEAEILGSMSDFEKRNKEFEEFEKNTKVDQKHQFYEDDDEYVIKPIEGEMYVKDIY